MRINFEEKAKEILTKALNGCEIESLNNCDDFQQEIQEHYKEEIGEAFMVVLNEWNGEETYSEVMKELEEEAEK